MSNDSEPVDETESVSPRGNRVRQTVLRVVVLGGLCAAFALANLPYQYRPVQSQALRWESQPFDFGLGEADTVQIADPVEAGWPMRFLVRHSFSESDQHTRFFVRALVANGFIAALVLLGAYSYLKRERKGISIIDLFVLVTLIASGMGYWQWQVRQADREREIKGTLSASGQVLVQSYFPVALSRWVPDAVRRHCFRITAVHLQDPTDEQIELLCQLPYLRALRVGGGSYDDAPLKRLPSMRYLQDVRIAGTELEPEVVLAISRCELVQQLNVSHTNCAEGALTYLSRLPRLTHLMAMETLVPLEAWQESELRNQLEELVLSRPRSGETGALRLKSWERLRRLTIQSLDEPLNPNAFLISVHDMPELEFCGFDLFQLVDLDLKGLPKLPTFSLISTNSQTRMADNEAMPSRTWARRVSLEDLPLITGAGFFVQDFESIEIRRCDAFKKLIVSSLVLPGSGDSRFDRTTGRNRCQRVIDAFGELGKPLHLSLRGCDLSGVDLSPLSGNAEIMSLDLQHCHLTQDSAKQISNLAVSQVDLRNTNVDPAWVGELLENLEGLESLSVDSRVTDIVLEDQLELHSLVFNDHKRSDLTSIKIVNVPKLRSPLVLSPVGHALHVENAPALSGLAVLTSLPQLKLQGVSGLKWFVGGGQAMDDEAVSEVLRAEGLTELTIGHSSASADVFDAAVNLRDLKRLEIPGAVLNDSVWRDWSIPPSLTYLDLRGCGLSADTTTRILRRGGWEKLMLSGNQIDPVSLLELNQSPELVSLGLGGAAVSKDVAGRLGPFYDLSQLDLAGAVIEPGALNAILTNAIGLESVDLTNASLDWAEVDSAIGSSSVIKFRMSPVDGPSALVAKLTHMNRFDLGTDPIEAWYRPVGRSLLGYDTRGLPVYSDPDDIEGPPEFERPDWPPGFFQLAEEALVNPGTPPATMPTSPATTGSSSGSVIGKALGQAFNLFGGGNTTEPASDEDAEGDKE